jgi:hypothetical protein
LKILPIKKSIFLQNKHSFNPKIPNGKLINFAC